MSLTPNQQQKIRRLRKAKISCLDIAATLKLSVKAVSGFIANEKKLRSARSMGEISRLVTVKDPEEYMRRRGVDYSEAA